MGSQNMLWQVSERDLADMNPDKARDLLVECFLKAQGGTFKRTAAALDIERDEEELRKTIRAAIRLKFKDLGCDFENPCARDIARVADVLADEAKAWGTPDDVVEHHVEQMRIIQSRLRT